MPCGYTPSAGATCAAGALTRAAGAAHPCGAALGVADERELLPMHAYLPLLAVPAIVGAGLVTGLLFAFSNFALAALADLPARDGMRAMQRINARILNPLFFVLFFGTPLLCVAVAAVALATPDAPGRWLLAGGALAYLAGPLAMTAARNVPLNDALAATRAEDAETAWPRYRAQWQRWNHARTVLGTVAVALLAAGLATV